MLSGTVLKVVIPFCIVGMLAIAMLFLQGCTSTTPTAALYQSIGTDKAAVDATATLYQSKTITATDANTVLAGASSAESALHVWDSLNQSGSATNVATAETAANQALAAILVQLQALQSRTPAMQPTTQPVAGSRFYGSTKPKYKVSKTQAAVLPAQVISLVELAVQLAPELEAWVNTLMSKGTVTQVQVTDAFTSLDASIANLTGLLNPPK